MPAPPITAATLYCRNSTTVDTGTGIDIRQLDDANSGAGNMAQTVVATHTQDAVERTWDPATTGVTTVADARDLQRLGYAITLSEFTPSDTRCKGYLPAGNATVTLNVNAAWTGTPVGGPITGASARASIWRYDPSTDAATLIASGTSTTVNWTTLESGTDKTFTVTLTWASGITFERGETLLLQVGVNVGTLANPITGTVTYTFGLWVDNTPDTRIVINTTTLRNLCADSGSSTGVGTTSRAVLARPSKTVTGVGQSSRLATVIKSERSITGVGSTSRSARTRLDSTNRLTTGVGVTSRAVLARPTKTSSGVGVTSRAIFIRPTKSISGVGVTSSSRLQTLVRSASITGVGVTSFSRVLIFVRAASNTGVGVTSARICLDISDLPDPGAGGGTIVRRIFLTGDDW